MRQIVEAGLRDMSNQLVYQECVRLERADLIEFCRDKVLNQKPQMKILSRQKSIEVNESDERLKREIKQLRNVCKVIRTGNVAMDILAEGEPVRNQIEAMKVPLELTVTKLGEVPFHRSIFTNLRKWPLF